MKKVRMILSAVAVFAIVGSALAFKTQMYSGTLKCKSSSAGTCPTSTTRYIQVGITDPQGVDLFCNSGNEQDNSCDEKLRVKADPK